MKKMVAGILLMMSFYSNAGEVNIKVKGMVCSMCAQGIQKKFSGVDSIKELKVNMDQKLVTIHTHEGKDIADETIKKLITEAGYNVASIERK